MSLIVRRTPEVITMRGPVGTRQTPRMVLKHIFFHQKLDPIRATIGYHCIRALTTALGSAKYHSSYSDDEHRRYRDCNDLQNPIKSDLFRIKS
ncbi:hypothetical protein EMIT0P265_40312 [Pseudomonas zeae]